MLFALNCNLDAVAPSGCRSDGVGALSGDAARRNMQSKELSWLVVEGDRGAVRRFEAEGRDVMRHVFLLGEHELTEPSNFSRRLVVAPITRRLALQKRGLGEDLDRLAAHGRRGKALAEGEQEPKVSFKSNLAAEDGERQALFTGEEAKPRLGVGGDTKVGSAVKSILDVERAISDGDGSLSLLGAGEDEMEGGIEPARLIGLEHEGHEGEQSVDGPRPETSGNGFDRLVLELTAGNGRGVRALDHIDRLGAFLERTHDLSQMPLLVRKIGANHVFARRADGHAIGRLVVGAVAQALPHRRRFGLIDALAVVEGIARIGDLLDEIGEAAQKLAIIVGKTGREIE